MRELVSIITPAYNAQRFIDKCIESVIAQSYQNWEMIIVDDGSTDETLEIIQQYINQDYRVILFSNDINLGASKSRNIAIKEAKGDYIAFLDSDDVWLPKKLEMQIELMDIEGVEMSYSNYEVIDEEGYVISNFKAPTKVTYNDMLKTSYIGTLTTIYSTKELGKIYFKDVGHEDYLLKLDILKEIDYAVGINQPLAQYRIVQDSLSNNKLKSASWQWKIYREYENIPLFKSILYFISYTYNGLKKY
jgi:glycosyltransferase involved in cell wall biosynthesis